MRRRLRAASSEGTIGGDSWAGFSDLMAGLLLVFIFVTVLKDVQLQGRVAEPAKVLDEWRNALLDLCNDDELKGQIKVDCETGTIELPEQIFFEFNRAELKPEGKDQLRRAVPIILDKLRARPVIWERLKVEVRGHSDPQAPEALRYSINLRKSEERAHNVLVFLTTDPQIPERDRHEIQMRSVSAGAADSFPPAECRSIGESEDCYALMRRAEIHLRVDDLDIRQELIKLLDVLRKQ